ncbi:MAG: RnfABCDGE type electron transport complex subunit G [Candidatus Cloacimonetes bacterium]|nr:RnfABCDGE type electron transport complex subunit G [Candidatus Cloacimonadota bacterium]
MKYYLKLGFILFIITAIASGVLAYLNTLTQPIIEENQLLAQEKARKEVLPSALTFEEVFDEEVVGETTYHIGKDAEDNIVGYTFVASLYGYSGDVKTMVGVNTDLVIEKIKIISQAETPGLGANCEKPEFQEQFSGKQKTEMKVDKDGGTIVSLTGATITTRTIANSIKAAMNKLDFPADETKEGVE